MQERAQGNIYLSQKSLEKMVKSQEIISTLFSWKREISNQGHEFPDTYNAIVTRENNHLFSMSVVDRTIILSLKLQQGTFSLKYFARYLTVRLIVRLIKHRPMLLQKVVELVILCTIRDDLRVGMNRPCIRQEEETI